MAVPLVDKGVVVVAVDYDIAPKGNACFFNFQTSKRATGERQPAEPFNCFSGNMDLIVSQVRRSVVSVVQQYSHIRYLFFHICLYIKVHVLAFPLAQSFINGRSLFALVSVVCTCVATLPALTWPQWFSPPTGPSTASLLRLKVTSIGWKG